MAGQRDPDALRQAACEFAIVGAAAAKRLFGRVTMDRKADNSPVTEADHAAQAEILRAIAARFPDHGVFVEETLRDPQRHAPIRADHCCWVVDPIDGTRNYARGVRVYGCSVGVLLEGRPVAGAVYDASSDCLYSAASSRGAFCDDRALQIADRPADRDTTVALGSFRRRPMPPIVHQWFGQYRTRNLGSASLHLAWTAAGLFDAVFMNATHLWDIAAGSLIVEEAGGRVTDALGGALWPLDVIAMNAGQDFEILAGSPKVHAELLASFRAT